MSNIKSAAGGAAWQRMVFDAHPLPMLIYDADSLAILEANPSATARYGYSRDEWLRMSVGDLYSAQDVPAALDELASLNDSIPPHTTAGRHETKDHARMQVDILQYPLLHDGKKAMLMMIRDTTAQRRLLRALRQKERDLDHAEQLARLGCWFWDLNRNKARWTDQTFRNFGVEPHSMDTGYESFRRIVHPDDEKMVDRIVRESISDNKPYDCTYRVVWPDGSVHFMHARGKPYYDKHDRPSKFVGTVLDVTRQQRIESQLRDAQRDLRKAQEIAHIGSWVWDVTQDLYHFSSDETFRIFGYKPDDMPMNTEAVLQALVPEDRKIVLAGRERVLSDPNAHYDVEYRIVGGNGDLRNIHSVAEIQRDAQGRPVKMLGIVQDITEQKRAEEKIRRLAYYDEVTGLPNRVLLRQELGKTLAASRRADQPAALLIIDVVHLRDINYTFGHATGDCLLKEVGMRIEGALPAGRMIARVGNVQFAVILPNSNAQETEAQIRRILAALEGSFSIAGIAYELGAGIGVASSPMDGTDADTLLRKADVARYQARQFGQKYALYQALRDPYKPRRLALLGEFRKAVNAGQIRLYCQPKANLRTGKIVGAEALVRWYHPELGLISPDQFIPLIEPTDLIRLLTRHMLEAAVRLCSAWNKEGIDIPLAINVSPRNLVEPDFANNIGRLLNSAKVDANQLGLEITESSLMNDPTTSIAALDRLSRMGLRLFVDDFGIGYSSLSYLTKLPVNVIKIDHSFTMHMLEDDSAATIVKSTIDLAHNLGMTAVAEGAASEDIWNALARLGCDEAQGYYICRPLPASEFTQWMSTPEYQRSGRPAPPIQPAGTH